MLVNAGILHIPSRLKWCAWIGCRGLKDNHGACGTGVYQLRATQKSGRPVSIPRACGIDREGILYIGQGNLTSRVGAAVYIGEDERRPLPRRPEVWVMWDSGELKPIHQFVEVWEEYDLSRICDTDFIEVRWAEYKHAGSMERELIRDYKKQFGDIPPGNRQMGG